MAEQLTIVALGDSTTAGTPEFHSPLEAPPNGYGNPESQYGYWIEKMNSNWRVLNRGINGERTDQILARFDRDVKAVRPDLLIILAGVNDLFQGRGAEAVITNLKLLYERAKRDAKATIVCSIIPYNGMQGSVYANMNKVNEWIRTYASQKGFGYADTHAAVRSNSNPPGLKGTNDGIHPDVEGYRLMAISMQPEIERLLKSSDKVPSQ